MTGTFGYTSAGPIGDKGVLGLIVLQVDETIESDMRAMFRDPEVALYITRIASGAEVTEETLAGMAPQLEGAAGLLPPSLVFDAVGYGCTSGTSVIGRAAVADAVRAGCRAGSVTEPVSALIAACETLGVSRLAFLSPYSEPVSAGLRQTLADHGLTCTAFGSFDEPSEAQVARIAPVSVSDAGLTLGRSPDAEALFLSCTNLRTLDVIEPLEAALGKPVLSSNQVLAWHLARLAQAPAVIPGALGRVRD